MKPSPTDCEQVQTQSERILYLSEIGWKKTHLPHPTRENAVRRQQNANAVVGAAVQGYTDHGLHSSTERGIRIGCVAAIPLRVVQDKRNSSFNGDARNATEG